MLVLTRKLGEKIIIGDDIIIKVLNIENNKVQIGVKAPVSIMIYRQELIERIRQQNESSIVRGKSEMISAIQIIKGLIGLKN
ncbi:MAG: hypothetical protein Kow0042_30620 [Calditrichia bacterium]